MWLRWTLATVAGFVLYAVLGSALNFGYAYVLGGATSSQNNFAVWLSALLGGAMFGALQSRVLKRSLPRLEGWTLVTTLGMLINVALNDLAPHDAFGNIAVTATGLLIELAGVLFYTILQWFVLRSWVHRAGWWILTVTPPVAEWILVSAGLLPTSARTTSETLLVLGVYLLRAGIYGALSGAVLTWLLRRPLHALDPAFDAAIANT